MTPDIVLELSVEQLISALNKKLTVEYTKAQPTTAPGVATLAAEIDALEKRVKEILHGVACLRNPLRPVNRLPPDLVTRCAAFVPHIDPKPIVSLTHVCRYWRGAIISNPSSWTLIGHGWKRLVPMCLERAGVVPLTVDISMTSLEQDGDFAQALLPHITRISSLSLTECSSLENMANFLPSTMLNPTVLKLKAPHAAEIHLYPVLSNIKSLVELKLSIYTVPFDEFIRFLESNPHLKILDLCISFPSTPVLTTLERGVSLPQLRRIALTCSAATTRALLSSLLLTRGINIEVREWDSGGDLTLCLPSPPTLIQDLLAPITTVKYLCHEGWLHLSGKNGSFSFYSAGQAISRNPRVFDLFDTGTVREFHLSFCDTGHLSPPLERLPALEAFVIYQTGYHQGLSALAEEPELCPSLKTIVFIDCFGFPIENLKAVLTKREHSNAARLHRVVIANRTCDFPKHGLVTQLRMLVPRVDFMMGGELPELL